MTDDPTRPAISRSASHWLPCRRCSIQTEVSTRTIRRGYGGEGSNGDLLRAAKPGQPSRAFQRDERLQARMDERRLLADAGQFRCLLQKLFVDIQRGSHMNDDARRMQTCQMAECGFSGRHCAGGGRDDRGSPLFERRSRLCRHHPRRRLHLSLPGYEPPRSSGAARAASVLFLRPGQDDETGGNAGLGRRVVRARSTEKRCALWREVIVLRFRADTHPQMVRVELPESFHLQHQPRILLPHDGSPIRWRQVESRRRPEEQRTAGTTAPRCRKRRQTRSERGNPWVLGFTPGTAIGGRMFHFRHTPGATETLAGARKSTPGP